MDTKELRSRRELLKGKKTLTVKSKPVVYTRVIAGSSSLFRKGERVIVSR